MPQVVQAKCPHCQNVLRIPAEWLSRSMRCKFCKNTFQARANNSASASANVTAKAPSAKAKVVGAVQGAAPARPVAAGGHFGFQEDDAPNPTPSIAKPRKKGRGKLMLLLAFFFLFTLGAAGAGVVVYKVFTSPSGTPKLEQKELARNDKFEPRSSLAKIAPKTDPDDRKDNPLAMNKKDNSVVPDPSPKKDAPKKNPPKKEAKKDFSTKKEGTKPPPFSNDPFPRRALLVSVNNYLMFNTVHYGSGQDGIKNGYPGSSTSVLRDRLTRPPMNFPASQVVELSDGVPPESRVAKAHSTQKSVIETTIKDFVDTCREQDRVLILFAGHCALLDDKAYLVPIDGNLKDAESLLPLKWVYDQLARCKAQQKLLILDAFRYSPSRGFELPSAGEGEEGTMPEGFDKELLNPPAGVLVWSSCIKEQSAVELDKGSAFLQALCHSLQGGAEMTGIAAPTQPMPVQDLVVKVNMRLKELLVPEKRTQLSRLTGKEMEGGGKYDPKELLPPQLTLKPPTANGAEAAGLAQVDSILMELKELAPVRESRVGDRNLLDATKLPAFAANKLDFYKADGYMHIADLQKKYKTDTAGFGKEFPLRAAYFDAVDKLNESIKIHSREVLPSPINPKQKAAFLVEQEPLGKSIFFLEQTLSQLKEAAELREKETSKRWQANLDYVQARLQSRLIYLFEYNYTLGQIRADNLPELAPGQSGWRIGTGKKIAVTEQKAKALKKDTDKLWKRIQDSYPGTPWALLAQRESMISLGLQWRPKSD